MERSLCLVFPVDELQVDGGGRAEQAMGFGLDISSERRDADVEPLNELHKEQKHREVNQIMMTHFDSDTTSTFITACFSRSQRSLVAQLGTGMLPLATQGLCELCALGEVENESHFHYVSRSRMSISHVMF